MIAPTTLYVIGQDPLKERESHTTEAKVIAQPTSPPFFGGGDNVAKTNNKAPTPGSGTEARLAPTPVADCSRDNEAAANEKDFVTCTKTAIDNVDLVFAPMYSALDFGEKAVAAFAQQDAALVASASSVSTDADVKSYRARVAALLAGRNIDSAVQAVGRWPTLAADDLSKDLQRYRTLIDKVKWASSTSRAAQLRQIEDAIQRTGTDTKADFDTRRQKMRDLAGAIDAVAATDYVDELNSPCGGGLFGKGLERKFTIIIVPVAKTEPSVTSDVTTVCATRAFVSTGFTFASGGERTFGVVAPNTAVTPAPTAYTIVESSRSDVRAISISFVNVALTEPSKSGNGWFGSFGVAIGTGGDSSTSFAGGVSYAFARTFTVTLGGFLGSQTQLAPGYSVGGPISSNVSNPPTVSRRTVRPFVGLSFNL